MLDDKPAPVSYLQDTTSAGKKAGHEAAPSKKSE